MQQPTIPDVSSILSPTGLKRTISMEQSPDLADMEQLSTLEERYSTAADLPRELIDSNLVFKLPIGNRSVYIPMHLHGEVLEGTARIDFSRYTIMSLLCWCFYSGSAHGSVPGLETRCSSGHTSCKRIFDMLLEDKNAGLVKAESLLRILLNTYDKKKNKSKRARRIAQVVDSTPINISLLPEEMSHINLHNVAYFEKISGDKETIVMVMNGAWPRGVHCIQMLTDVTTFGSLSQLALLQQNPDMEIEAFVDGFLHVRLYKPLMGKVFVAQLEVNNVNAVPLSTAAFWGLSVQMDKYLPEHVNAIEALGGNRFESVDTRTQIKSQGFLFYGGQSEHVIKMLSLLSTIP